MSYEQDQINIKEWLTTPLTRFTIAGWSNIWEVAGHNAYCLDEQGRIKEGCSYDTVEAILKEQGTGVLEYQVDRVYLPVEVGNSTIDHYELVLDYVDTSGKSLGETMPRYTK